MDNKCTNIRQKCMLTDHTMCYFCAVLFCFIFRFLLTGVGVLAGSLPAEAGDVRLLWAGGSLLLQAGFRTRKDTLEDFPCQGLSLRVSYNKKIYLCGFWRER